MQIQVHVKYIPLFQVIVFKILDCWNYSIEKDQTIRLYDSLLNKSVGSMRRSVRANLIQSIIPESCLEGQEPPE